MKYKKGSATIVLLIVIIILLAGGFSYYYMKTSSTNEPETQTKALEAINTSSWKTFTSASGFSLKYPATYTIEESENNVIITNTALLYTPKAPSKDLPSYVLTGFVSMENLRSGENDTLDNLVSYWLKLDEVTVKPISIKVAGIDAREYRIEGKNTIDRTLLINKIKAFNLSFNAVYNDDLSDPKPQDLLEMDAVLKSISFKN